MTEPQPPAPAPPDASPADVWAPAPGSWTSPPIHAWAPGPGSWTQPPHHAPRSASTTVVALCSFAAGIVFTLVLTVALPFVAFLGAGFEDDLGEVSAGDDPWFVGEEFAHDASALPSLPSLDSIERTAEQRLPEGWRADTSAYARGGHVELTGPDGQQSCVSFDDDRGLVTTMVDEGAC